MKKRVHSLFSILILFALLLGACSTAQPEAPAAEVEAEPVATSAASEVSEEVSEAEPEEESQGITITDMMGREVTLDAPATSVIAIGPGALRLYVYAGNLDYVVGVEQMETGKVSGKPYMLANPDLATLPVIGQGGPNNAPDPEKILTVAPDVIFSTYSTDAASSR